jgi:hypothetical protein
VVGRSAELLPDERSVLESVRGCGGFMNGLIPHDVTKELVWGVFLLEYRIARFIT